MKLSLETKRGIEILKIEGPVTERDLRVVRAGLADALKKGKNRIIVHLGETPRLPHQVLRELSNLDLLARELSGRIVLSGVTPALKREIESYAKPPVIACFKEMSDALLSFLSADKDESEESKRAAAPTASAPAPAASAPASSAAAPPTAAPSASAPAAPAPSAPTASGDAATGGTTGASEAPEVGKFLKEDIREREQRALLGLRKQNAELMKQNELLKEQVEALLKESKRVTRTAAGQERIDELEAQVEGLLKQLQSAPAAGKSSGKA